MLDDSRLTSPAINFVCGIIFTHATEFGLESNYERAFNTLCLIVDTNDPAYMPHASFQLAYIADQALGRNKDSSWAKSRLLDAAQSDLNLAIQALSKRR